MTIDAAWQQHLDADRGSLEPGKLADFVVLSGPLQAPNAAVVQTVVGGRVVYEAGSVR